MEKRVPFVLMCLLTSVILAACGSFQAERGAQATKIAADIFATQTTGAPTPLPPTSTPTPEPMGVTITGVIINLEDAEERYLAEDSYLQLVRLPADDRLHFSAVQGRLLYDSELAQIPIPHDDVFSFQVESLEPGTYLIAAQLLLEHRLPPGTLLVKSPRSWEYVNVEIPQDANLPLSFDLGEVAIPDPLAK